MTSQEARAKFPDQRIYWHTERHCWDASRHGAGHYESQATTSDISDKSAKVATPVDQAVRGVHAVIYFPTLEVNAWPSLPLPMVGANMSTWPRILDVDQPTKFERWHDRVTGSWGGQR